MTYGIGAGAGEERAEASCSRAGLQDDVPVVRVNAPQPPRSWSKPMNSPGRVASSRLHCGPTSRPKHCQFLTGSSPHFPSYIRHISSTHSSILPIGLSPGTTVINCICIHLNSAEMTSVSSLPISSQSVTPQECLLRYIATAANYWRISECYHSPETQSVD